MGYKTNKAWRLRNPDKRGESTTRYYRKYGTIKGGNKKGHKRGLVWTEKECMLVFDGTYTDVELYKFLGRSVKAIQTKRHRLKVLGQGA